MVKVLGVTIDDKLNFNKHIRNLCKVAPAQYTNTACESAIIRPCYKKYW